MCLDSLVSNKNGAYIAVFPVHGAPLMRALFLSSLPLTFIKFITAKHNRDRYSSVKLVLKVHLRHTKMLIQQRCI